MNLQDVFYHGIRDQIRRVLKQMSDEEIDRGLTAFEDGQSSWSQCFFARACPALELDAGRPEQKLQAHFKLPTAVPIRIVYCTFDGLGVTMKREDLAKFIREVRLDDGTTVNPAINELLSRIDYTDVEEKALAGCTYRQQELTD